MFSQFDLTNPEFRNNPYPFYQQLRQAAPTMFFPPMNIWFFTRYEDCVTAFKDSRLSSGLPRLAMAKPADLPDQLQSLFGVIVQTEMSWMLSKDVPAHTRMRTLVHKAFTPRMIENLRGRMQDILNKLLDSVQGASSIELIESVAFPFSLTVIAEMLGVPASDYEKFRRWSNLIIRSGELGLSTEQYKEVLDAIVDFSAYIQEIIEARRGNPSDDLIGALVAAEEQGEKLTREEVIANIILILVAGHETTVNLLGNIVLTLLCNPEQFEKLKANPSLIKSAAEECLRYESPAQMIARLATQEIEFKGITIQPGQLIGMMLGAANRDPEQFPDPEVFDITRNPNQHIAFGAGVHFCLGAPLARLESEVALTTLLQRLPNLKLSDKSPVYQENFVLRGLKSLTVIP